MFVKVVNGAAAAENAKSVADLKEVISNRPTEILINPDCPIRVIYDYIQEIFKIDCDLEFDLCDESGNLLFINDKEPWSNGLEHFTLKAVYFIVFFDKDEDNRIFRFVLQFPDSYRKTTSQFNDIMLKIKRQLNLTGSRTSKSGRSRSFAK